MFQEHKYYQRVFNAYHSSLYYDRNRYDGELGNATNPYFDPFISGPNAPKRPILEEWTYIRTDTYTFRLVFFLNIVEILKLARALTLGTTFEKVK
jgi:hypothetical protein